MAAFVKPPRIPLNDGNCMPAIGLGTLQERSPDLSTYDTCLAAVKNAIDIGYRHFDTATVYETEKAIGEAIRAKIKEGAIKRTDVFVTTKLPNTSHRRDDVVPELKKSLEDLGLDYVNMYIIPWPTVLHHPEGSFFEDSSGNLMYGDEKINFLETWKGMEECKRLGLTKSIGVSNFNRRQLDNLFDHCEISPANIQVECHVHHNRDLLVKYCRQKKIVLSCHSPLGNPRRSHKKDEDPDILKDETIKWVGENHRKTNAQVALRYLLQRGAVVLPKSNNPERQRENIEIFDFHLNDAEMGALNILNKDHRVVRLHGSIGHADF